MQTNIFDVLGIDVEVPKKQEKKKEAKKDTKSIKKEEKKDLITFPVQIITGYANTVQYQADDFEHKEVTATEVFKKFTSENASFPTELCGFFMKNKNTMVVFMKRTMSSDKTIMKVNTQTKYCLGDTTLDLSSFMTDTECELNATILIEGFQKEYPKYGQVKMAYSAINNSIIPCFVADEIENEVVLPVDVVFWNHEEFTITDNEVDIMEQKESNETVTKMDTKQHIKSTHILKLIENRFPEMKGCLKLYYNKETHSIIVGMKEEEKLSVEAKKEIMFPTDAEVSLFVHIHFQLHPDMFGGKKEITEKEFKVFLEDRYPEFSPERTIILYDEKKNLIMPGLKSSCKGALSIVFKEEEEEERKKKIFPFIREYEDGSSYRVECTSIGDFKVCRNGDGRYNQFYYKLPKIPIEFFIAARYFFEEIYQEKGTEALLQLFYDEENRTYFWYIPKQEAFSTNVIATRNFLRECKCILVADVHSHGCYNAFWSKQDNDDEKGTRIFGVMGGFTNKETYNECFRLGCGGYFSTLQLLDIVNADNLDNKMVQTILSKLRTRKRFIITKE